MTNKPAVLIIEDDLALAEVFSVILQYHGFNAEVINDGDIALERLATTTPDLIVLDLHLPKVSGPAILNYIRETERLNQVKVILATADLILVQDVESKADMLLPKPIGARKLVEAVKQLHPATMLS